MNPSRLLDRLNRSLTWQLLSPPANLPLGMRHRAAAEHTALLQAAHAARARVWGVAEAHLPARVRCSDANATHLLALDRDGAVVGALRLLVVDRARETPTGALLADFARVSWPAHETRDAYLAALDHWLACAAYERMLVVGGGLVVAERWRGTGLGVALGAAAVAMARLHHSRRSVAFTSLAGQAPPFFSLLGTRPLQTANGSVLEPFPLRTLGIKATVLTFDAGCPDPAIEPQVVEMAAQMHAMTALSPPEREIAQQQQPLAHAAEVAAQAEGATS